MRALGANVLIITGGKDALDKATKLNPRAVILGVNMPQQGGLETFEAILIQSPEAEVFLVRRSPHEHVPEAFLARHGSHFSEIQNAQERVGAVLIPLFDGNWQEYARRDLRPPKDNADQRMAPRVMGRGDLALEWEGARHAARLLNLSRSGALLGTDLQMPLGTRLPVHMTLPDGGGIVATVEVVRIKEEAASPRFAVGVRFLEIPAADVPRLELWITALRFVVNQEGGGPSAEAPAAASSHADEHLPPLAPGALDAKFVRAALNLKGDDVASLVGADPDPRLRWVRVRSDTERAAFARQDQRARAIQRAVGLRAKCGVFLDFIPTLAVNQGALADPLLNILAAMVHEIEEAEVGMEIAFNQTPPDAGAERQEIIASSNRLHRLKVRTVVALLDSLDKARWKSHPGYVELEKVRQRLGASGDEEVKYARHEVKVEEKKSARKFGFKVNRKLKVALAVLSFLAFAATLFGKTSGYVSVSKLELTFELTRAKRIEDNLELFCLGGQWDRLRDEDKLATMDSIEKFLTAERFRQAKLYDEQGKLLAATAVVQRPIGKPPVYSRRLKKLSGL